MNTKFQIRNTYFLFVSLLWFSCTNNDQIERINIDYMHWSTTTMFTIDCGYFDIIFSDHVGKKEFTDRSLLRSIENELASLEKRNNLTRLDTLKIDIRIKSHIHYRSGRTDTLCLGLISYTVLNDQIMSDNNNLFGIFRNELYPDFK